MTKNRLLYLLLILINIYFNELSEEMLNTPFDDISEAANFYLKEHNLNLKNSKFSDKTTNSINKSRLSNNSGISDSNESDIFKSNTKTLKYKNPIGSIISTKNKNNNSETLKKDISKSNNNNTKVSSASNALNKSMSNSNTVNVSLNNFIVSHKSSNNNPLNSSTSVKNNNDNNYSKPVNNSGYITINNSNVSIKSDNISSKYPSKTKDNNTVSSTKTYYQVSSKSNTSITSDKSINNPSNHPNQNKVITQKNINTNTLDKNEELKKIISEISQLEIELTKPLNFNEITNNKYQIIKSQNNKYKIYERKSNKLLLETTDYNEFIDNNQEYKAERAKRDILLNKINELYSKKANLEFELKYNLN